MEFKQGSLKPRIVFLITVAIVLVVYFVAPAKQPESLPEPAPSPIVNSVSTTSTPYEVGETKLYKAPDDLGFEFNYPAYLFPAPQRFKSEHYLIEDALIIQYAGTATGVAFVIVEKTDATDIQNVSFDFEAYYLRHSVSIRSKRKIIIAGSPALMFETQHELQKEYRPSCYDKWIQFIHNGNVISFIVVPCQPGPQQWSSVYVPEADETMSLFLSTLRLTPTVPQGGGTFQRIE